MSLGCSPLAFWMSSRSAIGLSPVLVLTKR
jgi:hypothetical protein